MRQGYTSVYVFFLNKNFENHELQGSVFGGYETSTNEDHSETTERRFAFQYLCYHNFELQKCDYNKRK